MASLSQMFPSVTRAVTAVRSIFARSAGSGSEDMAASKGGTQVTLAQMPDGLQHDLAELAQNTGTTETVTPSYSFLETLPGDEVELDREDGTMPHQRGESINAETVCAYRELFEQGVIVPDDVRFQPSGIEGR